MKLPTFNPHLSQNAQPKGLARYLDTLFTNMSSLLTANLLFILTCLPIVTIGPSLIALTRVCCKIICGKPARTSEEYFTSFKANFKAGIVLTFTLVPLLIWPVFMILSCFNSLSINFLPFCLYCILFFSICCFSMYFLPLLAFMKTGSTYDKIKNSMILCILGREYSILGSITTAVIMIMVVWFFPKTAPLLLLIHFSFSVYNSCFFGWKICDKFIFEPYYKSFPDQIVHDNY